MKNKRYIVRKLKEGNRGGGFYPPPICLIMNELQNISILMIIL